ncbi:MAG: hypothetical protein C5S48_02530 [Candidatus Methanogaster sp.]|nr:MAG: hypothetical protein C5S48_02530 [ANME-2 cluster archaeon]
MKKEVFIMVLIFIAATATLGCLSEKNGVRDTGTDQSDQMSNVETSSSGRSGGVYNAQTVNQPPMEPVTIDYAVLESHGWKVEEFPEFYTNIDFMYAPDSMDTVFISRDDDGSIIGIYAITENWDNRLLTVNEIQAIAKDWKIRPLTVNDITFSNMTTDMRNLSIENPIDKNIRVSICKMIDIAGTKYYEHGSGRHRRYLGTYSTPTYFDHSEKNVYLGGFDKTLSGVPYTRVMTVLHVQFLPTPKRGEKIIQTTEWIPVGEEQRIQLPKFAVFMKMEQLRPRGELILTARFDDSTGVTMSDAYKNHETITISLKWVNGQISPQLRKDLLKVMGGQDTELFATTVKLFSWQATIESTPLLQE